MPSRESLCHILASSRRLRVELVNTEGAKTAAKKPVKK